MNESLNGKDLESKWVVQRAVWCVVVVLLMTRVFFSFYVVF